MQDVVCESGADFGKQRKDALTSRLRARKPNLTGLPPDVSEFECSHFTATQAKRCE
jgi:hypothetical protein